MTADPDLAQRSIADTADLARRDFVPLMTLPVAISAVARRLGARIEHGHDDLDDFEAVLMVKPRGRRLLFIRYRGAPKRATDVLVPRRNATTATKRFVMASLDLVAA
ncbi:MAG: hypothetical protein GC150_03770 [Rhizobiales bacterium]|nr:hypothetical protein [Hyphomicrobiales bacterium]